MTDETFTPAPTAPVEADELETARTVFPDATAPATGPLVAPDPTDPITEGDTTP